MSTAQPHPVSPSVTLLGLLTSKASVCPAVKQGQFWQVARETRQEANEYKLCSRKLKHVFQNPPNLQGSSHGEGGVEGRRWARDGGAASSLGSGRVQLTWPVHRTSRPCQAVNSRCVFRNRPSPAQSTTRKGNHTASCPMRTHEGGSEGGPGVRLAPALPELVCRLGRGPQRLGVREALQRRPPD